MKPRRGVKIGGDMAKAKFAKFRVKHTSEGWAVFRDGRGQISQAFRTKRQAITEGRWFARASWSEVLVPAQLFVHRLDGDFERDGEATYPRARDPKRSKG